MRGGGPGHNILEISLLSRSEIASSATLPFFPVRAVAAAAAERGAEFLREKSRGNFLRILLFITFAGAPASRAVFCCRKNMAILSGSSHILQLVLILQPRCAQKLYVAEWKGMQYSGGFYFMFINLWRLWQYLFIFL